MHSSLKKIIENIDRLKKEVDIYRPLKPEQEQRLLQKIRLDWNYHSSKIEGNTLSYGETKALLLWGITAQGKPLRYHLEIKGHNEAVEYIIDILKGKEIPLTESFIREMHKVIIPEEYEIDAETSDGKPIKRKIIPGEYKKFPNHVKTPTGEMFYFASPEETPAKMFDLMNWYKKVCEEKKEHPLIIASLFHYQFVRIHPFDDGNGRMSRLLMNLILMQFGYPPAIVHTEMRAVYINSLQYADADDLNKFVVFIGERLVESLELWLKAAKGETIEELDDIDKMVKLLEKKLDNLTINNIEYINRSEEVLKNLYNKSIKKLLESCIVTLEKFSVFFIQYEFSYGKVSSTSPSTKKQMFDDLDLNFCKNDTSKVSITYCYYYLKKNPIIKASTWITLSIELKPVTYNITLSNYLIEIEKSYTKMLTDDEISFINIEIAKYINGNIDKEIKKYNENNNA